MRLNKAIAASGHCSRRKADELIARGEVAVNGIRIQALGTQIDPQHDAVTVAGKRIELKDPSRTQHLYLALHKPRGYVSTARDPQGRKIVLDLLPQAINQQRVVPAGRLDYNSEGLLLLSNDGALIYTLTHPGHHVEKVYQVLVHGRVTQDRLQVMRRGMTLEEGENLSPIRVAVEEKASDKTWLRMILIQGVNRQIRRMCRDLDLRVLRLIRTREGPVRLQGLPPGSFRHLRPSEIRALTPPACSPDTSRAGSRIED